jgi:quercetin dioxygenase-like cupin family protein
MHHQCAFVLEGEFEMTVDGETQILKPGRFVVIPPDISHSGRAITDCRLLDIFNPVREDYR